MTSHLKIAIVGFGSIAKRHLENIKAVLEERNISFEIDLIRRKNSAVLDREYQQIVSQTFTSAQEAPSDYDVVFITNPTALHYETISDFANKTKHMFIEKPVFDSVAYDVKHLVLNEQGIYYVACPLRYTSVIDYLAKNINFDDVYSLRAISSSYLPDWRPDVDYRKVYSSNSDQGGGVSIDLIHEWDYIAYLVGVPNEVHNIKGHYSNLELNSDDISIYIARYDKLLVELHLDYFGRETQREVVLMLPDETIVADIHKSRISFMKSGKVLEFGEERNSFQKKEIEAFFDMIEGKRSNSNPIEKAIQTLKLTMGVLD